MIVEITLEHGHVNDEKNDPLSFKYSCNADNNGIFQMPKFMCALCNVEARVVNIATIEPNSAGQIAGAPVSYS